MEDLKHRLKNPTDALPITENHIADILADDDPSIQTSIDADMPPTKKRLIIDVDPQDPNDGLVIEAAGAPDFIQMVEVRFVNGKL